MSLFEELKRRNVFRVGLAYVLLAWVVLQAADFALDLIDAPNWIIQAMFIIGVAGLPVTLFFAWAFEVTPEGIKREADIDRTESIAPQTGRKLDRAILVFLALAVILLLGERYFLSGHRAASPEAHSPSSATAARTPEEAPGNSIAVLPFVNMSADEDNEYFSDGISEELLNVLVRVSALEVASRTSSFAYKGKDTPISQIAGELGVDHVLEGSVRKSGDRVRITAQLIDARTDRHLWSDTYDRQLEDIFGIQDEISNSIVEALKVALDVGEVESIERLNRPTDNPEAYELYLQGRYQWRLRQEENIRNSIETFEAAIALDPDFAKAHEGLAAAWTVLPAWSNVPTAKAEPHAMAAANRALELDPSLGMAMSIRAHFQQIEGNWVDAHAAFSRALELEPRNPTVVQWTAEFYADAGYLQLALETALRAYRLDPASRVINAIVAARATDIGDDELALRHAQKALELGLDPLSVVSTSFDAHLRQGMVDDIKSALVDSARTNNYLIEGCTLAILEPSDQTSLRDLIAVDTGFNVRARAWCAARVPGNPEDALDVFEEAIPHDMTRARYLWFNNPTGKRIRQSDRFGQLLREFGLVALYETLGWPDLCRPLDGDNLVCE